MPGGNTHSKDKPYTILKTGSWASPDVKALVGGEMAVPGLPTEFGLSNFNPTPEGPLHGEPKMLKVGKPAMVAKGKRGSGRTGFPGRTGFGR